MKKIDQITIIGAGLLGGSLALAIKRKRMAKRIYAICRTSSSARKLKNLGIPATPVVGFDPKILKESDLVLLSAPVRSIESAFRQIAPHLKRGAKVMDVGSTKSDIQKASRVLPKRTAFIGCHPMAGSEKTGPEFSMANLYQGANCFITKTSNSAAMRFARRFWNQLGAKTVMMNAKRHDALVARISHLPHLTSVALLLSILSTGSKKDLHFGATGLRGMLRISGANPPMWMDIFASNRPFVQKELRSLIRILQSMDRAFSQRNHKKLLNLLYKAEKSSLK